MALDIGTVVIVRLDSQRHVFRTTLLSQVFQRQPRLWAKSDAQFLPVVCSASERVSVCVCVACVCVCAEARWGDV